MTIKQLKLNNRKGAINLPDLGLDLVTLKGLGLSVHPSVLEA
jgi:hypothetical protein